MDTCKLALLIIALLLNECLEICRHYVTTDVAYLQILIKAVFEAPNDLVAIDDITYEAILCGFYLYDLLDSSNFCET